MHITVRKFYVIKSETKLEWYRMESKLPGKNGC
jgi:hypothetical protein